MTESMHLPLDKAVEQLRWRRENTSLQRDVEAFIKEDIPCVLGSRPCAVLFRHLATPDKEASRFMKAATQSGLPPLCLEFSQDQYMSRNRDKAKLGKLRFARKARREGEWHYEYLKVIKSQVAEHLPLGTIQTTGGMPLKAFHHAFLAEVFPEIETCDISNWVLRHGERAESYYRDFFMLFLSHGILFETFLEDDDEGPFTHNVIRPAYQAVVEQFGFAPLIVELVSPVEWQDKAWWGYDDDLKEIAKRLVENPSP